jgi:serpin B
MMPGRTGYALVAAMMLAGPAASASAETLSREQAEFGFRLIDRLATAEGEANVIVSPASLAATLAYLDLGADAGMRAALAKAVGFGPDDSAAGLESLRDEAKVLGALPSGWGPLTFANAIFVDPAVDVFPAALATLTDAGMTAEVAAINEPVGLAAINDWVKQATDGAIPTILDEPLTGAALVALNAFRFKDDWAHQFETDQTKAAPFHLAGGGTTEVKMMRRPPTTLATRQDERFVATIMPYETARFAMVLVTTKDGAAMAADFASVTAWLSGEGFAEGRVTLAMPKFDLAATMHLLPVLDALGLAEGQSDTAFSGFSETPIILSDVIQKTKIAVDERGTDASAATAVIGVAGSRPDPEIVSVTLDRPFLFAIREEVSGLILLAGYVGNPAAD